VFLYLVESGLRGGNTRFAPETFNFLQVCRRWNEVAVGYPRLWSLWVAGALKAWPLFKSRSREAPLSLTWRPQLPDSARDVLMDPTIPRRTRQLDFSGTRDQLAHFLSTFSSSPPSNVSSIRLQLRRYDGRKPQADFARLLSSSLPKLSKLNVGNFLPNPSSPIFTSSKLTSLKLFLPYKKKGQYTLGQFSQILQQHPDLQELDLNHGAIPLSETPGARVPFVLPRLIDLRLYGTNEAILRFIDFIGMSSPLHRVVIHFDYTPDLTVPALVSAVEKTIMEYYGCRGLGYPRKIETLTISSPRTNDLAFDARPRSPPTSRFELRFPWIGGYRCEKVLERTFCLLPSSNVQEFTVNGMLPLTKGMVEKMTELSHLRLHDQGSDGLRGVLWALSIGDQGASSKSARRASIHARIDEPHRHTVPKLELLTMFRSCLCDVEGWLLDVMEERHEHNRGLKKLAVRSCWIFEFEDQPKLREVVQEVEWEGNITLADGEDLDDGDSGDSDSEGDVDVCELSHRGQRRV